MCSSGRHEAVAEEAPDRHQAMLLLLVDAGSALGRSVGLTGVETEEEVVTGPTTLARLHHPRCHAQPLYSSSRGTSERRRGEHLASLRNPFMVTPRLATDVRGDRVLQRRHPISPRRTSRPIPCSRRRRFRARGGRQQPTGIYGGAPRAGSARASRQPGSPASAGRREEAALCRGNIIKCSLKTGLASAE